MARSAASSLSSAPRDARRIDDSTPDPADYPDADPALLVAVSAVFQPTAGPDLAPYDERVDLIVDDEPRSGQRRYCLTQLD